MLTSGLLLISTGSSRIFHWYFLCALKISTLSLLIGGGFAGPGWAQSSINCDLSCTGTVIEDATDDDDRIAEDGIASDSSSASFTATTEDQELIYGVYRVSTDSRIPNYAVWQYEIDNSDPQTNALGAGETGTDSFTITASDGGSVTVTITVIGANDAAVINGDFTGSVMEDDTSAQTATGTVTVMDVDGTNAVQQNSNIVGVYGTLAITSSDGTWTYTLDNTLPATNALAQGATVTDTLTILAADGTEGTVTITVTGADDAAVIGGDLTGSVMEDDTSAQTATGTVTVSDPDSPTTITAQTTSGTYGSLVLRADGTWTYTLDDTRTATNALTAGATETDSFSIATSDGSTETISITVMGADDASVIGGTLTGSVTEDDTQTATGTVTVSDPDSPTTITAQTTSGTYGSLVLRADGTWTYTLDDARTATNALADGATATDSFRIETSDGSTETISITVMGGNDAAVISGTLTGSVIEDGTSEQTTATGTVTVTDVDSTNAVRQNSNIVGVYGTLAITSSDGTWTYTLDNTLPATNALADGATATDTLTILAADGTEGMVRIMVTGADDASVIGGDLTGSVMEDDTSAQTATGTVTVSDPDSPTTITAQTTSGTYGSLVLRADGTWTYTLDNMLPATNALADGATATDTLTILAADGTEGTVTITVTGAGDPGVIEGTLRGAVKENERSASSASGTVMVTDVDGATITAQTSVDGTYGSFSIETDGKWTYTLDNTRPATNVLAEGATETDSFPIAASDGSTATISITVMGGNDAAVIVGTLTGSVIEDDTSAQRATGTVTVTDVDGTNAVRQNLNIAGVYGTLAITSSGGVWIYTLDNTLPATNALADGATATDTLTILAADGTEGTVTITVTGAGDPGVIEGTLRGAVKENERSASSASGTVMVTDVDGATITAQTSVDGTYGSFSIETDGTWTYTLDNTRPATNALAEGATETDSFPIAASDGSTAMIRITVMGGNDAAVIGGTLTGSVIEDDTSAQRATGTVTVSDPDSPTTITAQTTSGTYGSLVLRADGTWTYTLDNTLPATNALADGATATDTLTILAADGTEGTVTITVTGAGDPGLIEGTLRGAVTADDISASSASGTVMVTDMNGATITAQTSDGTYGSFSIEMDGTWTYMLNNDDPDTDALIRGETETETFTIMASDGTTATVTITVTGASMSVAGVMVTPQALEVTETAGESQADVYTVFLRGMPSGGDVIITPTSADPSVATVSGGPLVFRQDNWYQPQSVTVTGVDDTVVEPAGRMTEITHTISGGGYDNVAVASVTVTVTDDDDPPEKKLDEVNKEIAPSIVNEVARRQIAIITGRLETISSGPPMGNLSMEEVVTDVADYLFSHHQDIQANGFDWRQALSGNSFSFALANTSVSQGSMDMDDGDSSSSSSGPMSFWGGIDYSSLEDKIEGFDLDGGITSFDFGVDKEFRSDLVAGVLLSITNSEFDLTQGSTDSTYEVDIATVNPYISWEASEDLSLWASVGYGRGQADLTDDSTNDTVSKSGDFTRFSAGGRFQLWQSEAGTALALKLDGTTANFLDADMQNIRLATELSHGFSIESGALNTALELGLLMSSADESAAELAGRLHWQGDAGFSASARSRVLLGGGDREEWGIGGTLRYTTGGAGEGLMMSLEPSFGISNPQLLSDLWSAPRSDLAITTEAPTARLNAKLAYGFPTSDGLLTPYTDLSFSETTSIYGTGLRYGLPTGLDLDLKGMRKTSTTDAAENTILLELRSDL